MESCSLSQSSPWGGDTHWGGSDILNKGQRSRIQQDVCCNNSAYSCVHTRKELHSPVDGMKVFSKKAKSDIVDYLSEDFVFFLKRNFKSFKGSQEYSRWSLTHRDNLWFLGFESRSPACCFDSWWSWQGRLTLQRKRFYHARPLRWNMGPLFSLVELLWILQSLLEFSQWCNNF